MEEVKENTEKENTVKENTGNIEKTGRLKPKHWIIIGIAAALIVLAGVMLFIFGGSSARELQEQLDLGQKYLEEMNYEEAAVAFQTAIEIDPMSVDAYLGLVEVYIRTGDFDTALEYAKKGYEMTGDERLKAKIDMIESGNITASNGWSMKESHYDGAGALTFYEIYRYGKYGQGKESRYGIVGISVYNPDGSLLDEREDEYDEEGKRMVFWSAGWAVDGGNYGGLNKIEYDYDSEGNETGIRSYRYNVDGALEAYTEYEYDSEGHNIAIKTDYYDEDGTIAFRDEAEYDYDSEGHQIASRSYNDDGTLEAYMEYEYDSEGKCIGSKQYDADGALSNYNEYEYDSEGHKIAWRAYDADGTLFEYSEEEYDSEGNLVATRYYYGDGTLMSESRR